MKNREPVRKKQQKIVLARPGCGKTYNLASRIYKAIVEDELNVTDILCVTFTRQAASEMRYKVRAKFKKDRKKHPSGYPVGLDDQIGTLHSYCYRCIQEQDKEQKRILIDPDTPLGQKIANRLSKESKNKDVDSKNKDVRFNEIQYLSFRMKVEEEFPRLGIKVRRIENRTDLNLAKEYHDIKEEKGLIDYGDILIEFYRDQLNETHDNQKYKLILVDEAQDLNKLQLEIIKMLVSEDGEIVYYADPGQSIYSFQGVNLKILSELRDSAEPVGRFIKNRRSTPEIVSFVNEYYQVRLQSQKVLEDFPIRPQTSKLKSSGPGWLKLIYSCSRLQERKEIMRCIDELPREESCAILTRTNKSADEIINHFTKQRKYFVYNPANEVHWTFIDVIIAHLKVCFDRIDSDQDNQENWKRLISSIRPSGSFFYGEKTYDQMATLNILPSDLVKYSYGGLNYNFAEKVQYETVISNDDRSTILSLQGKKDAEEKISDKDIRDIAKKIKEGQIEFFNQKDIKKAQSTLHNKYLPIYEAQQETLKKINGNPEGLWRIVEWLKSAMIELSASGLIKYPKFGLWDTIKKEVTTQMKHWLEEEVSKGEKEKKEWIRSYINKLCDVLFELDKGEIVRKTDMPIHKVNVMTVHQAKGRQFDNIIMYNATRFEYKRGQEEDRIFYVGITRAKRRIIISYSDSFALNSEKKPAHPPRKIDKDATRRIHWLVKILSQGKRHMRKSTMEKEIIEEILSEMGASYKYKAQTIDGLKALKGIIVRGKTQESFNGTISYQEDGEIKSIILTV